MHSYAYLLAKAISSVWAMTYGLRVLNPNTYSDLFSIVLAMLSPPPLFIFPFFSCLSFFHSIVYCNGCSQSVSKEVKGAFFSLLFNQLIYIALIAVWSTSRTHNTCIQDTRQSQDFQDCPGHCRTVEAYEIL